MSSVFGAVTPTSVIAFLSESIRFDGRLFLSANTNRLNSLVWVIILGDEIVVIKGGKLVVVPGAEFT